MAGSDENVKQVEGTELRFPREDWRGFARDHFGPSVVWALLGIGSSHVILAPTIGARYGAFGVVLFALVYAVKWGGWELGIRYTYATGQNPVEAYEHLPGPDRWGQWLTFGITLFLWTMTLGAIAGGTASFVDAFFDQAFGISLGVVAWYVLLVVPTGVLIYFSTYQLLENFLKLFVVGLGILLVFSALAAPPSTGTVVETLGTVPDLTSPVFLALFAGAAAYTPVGLSSSIALGSWSTAKGQGARELETRGLDPEDPVYHEYIAAWMRTGMRDFNVGYVFSFLLVASMVLLSTATLYGSGTTPSGGAVPFAVGSILEPVYGPWAFYVMVLGATVALLSTVVSHIDATARVCADVLGLVRNDEDSEAWRRRFVALVTAFGVLPMLVVGNFPVVLITVSAALIGLFQVFFYAANYYVVVTRLPETFHPSTARTVYYVVGMTLVAVFGLVGALNEFGLLGAAG